MAHISKRKRRYPTVRVSAKKADERFLCTLCDNVTENEHLMYCKEHRLQMQQKLQARK